MMESLEKLRPAMGDKQRGLALNLEILLDLSHAEYIQVLCFDTPEETLCFSDFKNNLVMVSTELQNSISLYTQKNTYCESFETINSSESKDSSFLNHSSFRYIWKTLALYDGSQRLAVVNLAYCRFVDTGHIPQQIVKELLMPHLVESDVLPQFSQAQLEQLTSSFLLKLHAVNSRQQLFSLLNTEISRAGGYDHITVFVSDEHGKYYDFFYTVHPPELNIFKNVLQASSFHFDEQLQYSFYHNLQSAELPEATNSLCRKSAKYLKTAPDNLIDIQVKDLSMKEELTATLVIVKIQKETDERNLSIPFYLSQAIALALRNIIRMEASEFLQQQRLLSQEMLKRLVTGSNIVFYISRLYDQLKDLLDFDSHFFAIPSKDNLHLCVLDNYHPDDIAHASAPGATVFPINDIWISKALFFPDPILLDLDVLVLRGALPEYMLEKYRTGCNKVVMVGLQFAGEIIGLWMIFLKPGQPFGAHKQDAIKNFTSPLALLVASLDGKPPGINRNDII